MWKLIEEQGEHTSTCKVQWRRTDAMQIADIGCLIRESTYASVAICFVPGARLYTSSDGKTTLQGAK